MLQRLALLVGVMLLLSLAMHGCTPGYYFSVQLAKVNGKPHMLVEYSNPAFSENDERFFSVYTPKGQNWDEWEPVMTDRLGRAYTLFAAQPSGAATPDKPETPEVPGEKKT